ncbi:MAG: ABC-2 transporter permease [Lachnospiraceae bacterium]|nr:ABC-2 transporter permease [Lachnospiraceae bacterium]
MKGLIRKDLYFLENSLKMLIIAMIVIGIGVSFLISAEIFIIIFPIVLGSVILITIPKEKNNKWDKFIAMTPLSKDTLWNSKYILYLSMTILGLIIGIAVTFLSYIFTKEVNFMDMYSSIGLSIAVSLLAGGISIPINFLWSEEKAIIGQISSYSLIAMFLVAILYGINFFIPVKDNLEIIFGVLGIISVVFYVCSWNVGRKKVLKLEYN